MTQGRASHQITVIPLECGWITLPLSSLLEGEPGSLRVPVPAYLIRHPKGDLLFDSGMHPEMGANPKKRHGGNSSFQFEMKPEHSIIRQLAIHDVTPEDIAYLVNSHLHFDHAGGNALIPHARIIIHRDEWRAGKTPELCAKNYFDPKDYDLGQDRIEIDGSYDLFEDGTIMTLPTPGHTPGHQSLRVRTRDQDILLTADCCYLARSLEHHHLPSNAHDKEQMLRTFAVLEHLKQSGSTLIFGHDPDQWQCIRSLISEPHR